MRPDPLPSGHLDITRLACGGQPPDAGGHAHKWAKWVTSYVTTLDGE